jgi:hypothetical protein
MVLILLAGTLCITQQTQSSPTAQQAQTSDMVNRSDLSGAWVNVDPNTRGLVRIDIDGKNIHPFGACHPNPCDWGILQGTSFNAGVDSRDAAATMALKRTAYSETTLTLARETGERLRVDVFTHYTGDSNRADYHSTNYFTRDLKPASVAAAQQFQPSAQRPISSNGNQVLVVWKAGSPASNETPDSQAPFNLERKAERMGLGLEVHAFRRANLCKNF